MIEITGADLVKLVKTAYDLSKPQGMGFVHYKPGPLPDSEARDLVKVEGEVAVSLDYLHGRACKMNVWRKEGKLFIEDKWFDHKDAQLKELLKRIGKPQP